MRNDVSLIEFGIYMIESVNPTFIRALYRRKSKKIQKIPKNTCFLDSCVFFKKYVQKIQQAACADQYTLAVAISLHNYYLMAKLLHR